MTELTPDNIERMLMNPFYAITVAEELVAVHIPRMREKEWVLSNVAALTKDPEPWLMHFLDILVNNTSSPDDIVNPYLAINIVPMFAVPHPPLISEEQWVMANAVSLHEITPAEWLAKELTVLQGNYPSGSPPKSKDASTRRQLRGKRRKGRF